MRRLFQRVIYETHFNYSPADLNNVPLDWASKPKRRSQRRGQSSKDDGRQQIIKEKVLFFLKGNVFTAGCRVSQVTLLKRIGAPNSNRARFMFFFNQKAVTARNQNSCKLECGDCDRDGNDAVVWVSKEVTCGRIATWWDFNVRKVLLSKDTLL